MKLRSSLTGRYSLIGLILTFKNSVQIFLKFILLPRGSMVVPLVTIFCSIYHILNILFYISNTQYSLKCFLGKNETKD